MPTFGAWRKEQEQFKGMTHAKDPGSCLFLPSAQPKASVVPFTCRYSDPTERFVLIGTLMSLAAVLREVV